MDSARCAIRREIEETGLFRLKHRSEAGNEAFSNLVGEEWEQHALERDLAKRSAVKTVVPIRHGVVELLQGAVLQRDHRRRHPGHI